MSKVNHFNKVIFLAEDDMDDHELLESAFTEIDPSCKLLCISNGRKFVAHLESMEDYELPALIILDYNIPELNGMEIVKALNRHPRYSNIPKIMWSTSNSPVFKSMSVELGVQDYIVKPSDLASFMSIAKHMLSFIRE